MRILQMKTMDILSYWIYHIGKTYFVQQF